MEETDIPRDTQTDGKPRFVYTLQVQNLDVAGPSKLQLSIDALVACNLNPLIVRLYALRNSCVRTDRPQHYRRCLEKCSSINCP